MEKEEEIEPLKDAEMKGYIFALKDTIKSLQRDVERYEDTLKWRKKFRD